MSDRILNKHGIPEPLNEAERHEATKAYIEATREDDKVKIAAVLQKFPFLAGRDWKQYQPTPSAS